METDGKQAELLENKQGIRDRSESEIPGNRAKNERNLLRTCSATEIFGNRVSFKNAIHA
jgi:hypothetical protein